MRKISFWLPEETGFDTSLEFQISKETARPSAWQLSEVNVYKTNSDSQSRTGRLWVSVGIKSLRWEFQGSTLLLIPSSSRQVRHCYGTLQKTPRNLGKVTQLAMMWRAHCCSQRPFLAGVDPYLCQQPLMTQSLKFALNRGKKSLWGWGSWPDWLRINTVHGYFGLLGFKKQLLNYGKSKGKHVGPNVREELPVLSVLGEN